MTSGDTYGEPEIFSDPVTTEALAGTRPWVLFMAIVAYIGTAFVILAAVVLVVASTTQGPRGSIAIGLIYLGLAALYFLAARHLMAYATGISAYLSSNRVSDLNRALMAQMSFWRLIGFLTIVGFVLGVIVTIVSLLAITALTDAVN